MPSFLQLLPLMNFWSSTGVSCTKALIYLIHFPKGNYPVNLTQREVSSEVEKVKRFFFSYQIATRFENFSKCILFDAQAIKKSHLTGLLS